jgi:hypothetical protein
MALQVDDCVSVSITIGGGAIAGPPYSTGSLGPWSERSLVSTLMSRTTGSQNSPVATISTFAIVPRSNSDRGLSRGMVA